MVLPLPILCRGRRVNDFNVNQNIPAVLKRPLTFAIRQVSAFTWDSELAAAVTSCHLPTQLHPDVSTKKRRLSDLLEEKALPREDSHGKQDRISTALVCR